MRAHLPSYELRSPHGPQALGEVLALLAERPGEWRPFAGGTDLMVLFEAGKLAHRKFVSIWGIPELRGIDIQEDRVEIGALTTFSELQRDPVIRAEFPNLVRSSAETGAVAIQNRGTLGGNIANASPAADSSPCLLAYGARVEIVSVKASRAIAYRDFHLGYKKTALAPEELVSKIILPRAPAGQRAGMRHYFRKVGTRKAQAISKICVAAVSGPQGIRAGFGSVGPVPVLLELAPGDGPEKARELLSRKISPIDDIRSTAEYRLQVSLNLLQDFHVELGRAP